MHPGQCRHPPRLIFVVFATFFHRAVVLQITADSCGAALLDERVSQSPGSGQSILAKVKRPQRIRFRCIGLCFRICSAVLYAGLEQSAAGCLVGEEHCALPVCVHVAGAEFRLRPAGKWNSNSINLCLRSLFSIL
jgi:hypothetical protein